MHFNIQYPVVIFWLIDWKIMLMLVRKNINKKLAYFWCGWGVGHQI